VTDHRRPSIDGRGPGIDLFDDPPWDSRPDRRRTALTWLGHAAFVGLLVLLALLGLLVVIAVVSFVALIRGLHFDIGPIDVTPPPPSTSAMDIVVSTDGTRAYLTEPNNDALLVLDTATGRLLASIGVGSDPSGLALSPDGSQVWVVDTTLSSPGGLLPTGSSGTGSVSVVSTSTDGVIGTVDVGDGPIDVAFSPDGRTAYVTDNGFLEPGSVSVVDTATLGVVRTLAMPVQTSSSGSNPTSVAVSPDGKNVWVSEVSDLGATMGVAGATGTADSVSVFSAATGAPVATIPVGAGPFFLALSRDGRDAYVADKLSCDVREIDTASFRVVGTVRWPVSAGCPFGLAPGPFDGVVYTVTGSDHSLNEPYAGRSFGAVDFATGQARVAAHVGRDPVTVALSPDATTAYVVDADRLVVELVDPADGTLKGTFTVPD
jgi:YVTN family beta-propeller protein